MGQLVCEFTYQGAAVAKGRPRVTMRGGHARAYTPKKTVDYETAVGLTAQLAMREAGSIAVDEPVSLIITITRAPLKSWSKKTKAEMMGKPATGSLDLDNQIKAIMDALNGVCWLDDKQVAKIEAERFWGESDLVGVCVQLMAGS